jgi:hypothetical protein
MTTLVRLAAVTEKLTQLASESDDPTRGARAASLAVASQSVALRLSQGEDPRAKRHRTPST